MSEIIDRVARVLFSWQYGHDRWDEAEPEEREDCVDAARAVIQEMREPSESVNNTIESKELPRVKAELEAQGLRVIVRDRPVNNPTK